MKPHLTRLLEQLSLALALLTLAWGPLAQGSTFTWGFSGLILLGCVTFTLTLFTVGLRGQVQIANPWWVLAALVLLGWIWASTTWAPYQLEAQRWAGVWTAVLGVALSLHLLATTHRRQQAVLTTLLLSGAAAVVIALLQQRGVILPGYQALPGTPEQYLTGPYFHPSHFSGYLVGVAAVVSTVVLCTRVGWHTLPLLALAVGVQYVNLKTDGSSIPAVMLAAVLPLVVWAWTKRVWLGAVLTVMAISGAAGGAYLLGTVHGQALFAAHKQQLGIKSQNLEGFLQTRYAIHYFGEQLWRAHPTFGVGLGQYPTEFQQYRRPKEDVPGSVDHAFVNYAHSDYYQMLAELGTPGLVLFLLFLATSILTRPSTLTALAWFSCLAAYLCTGFYDSHLTAIPGTMLTVFALAGVPMSLSHKAVKQTLAEDQRDEGAKRGLLATN
ncbi:O-antigen ligase family protein [Deinococcus peraridilitoris]|uniref:Lipid A core-O-antigen ligase-like enyme n=1 Tax=Deinococcus peraridilitoris (strain DSM 19664 / LMG 22246 / CIP 109416 / KR-200) TaxID=937777 RepID=L0A8N5_DEIPD|nr:O-antigen ligase family protein [Deinococcus peraridilitoris]AFZ69522.1 lipid A core-O-antigen ligase-like enyme [Deinococcus peraridilitoris DSM 19664]